MQTFLPYKLFARSAAVLDYRRLGKQRVEAGQILEILLNQPILPASFNHPERFQKPPVGWKNHPAVKMWKNHEEWLIFYLSCMINEWTGRGYRNTIQVPQLERFTQPIPPWLGSKKLHQSHRSNLIRKAPEYYQRIWPNQTPDLPYFWPVK